MKVATTILAAAVAGLFSVAALAQSVGDIEQRDLNQQRRIEQGLQSGQLTVREAARLESEAARVNRIEAQALRDGQLSGSERARIDAAQDRLGRDTYRQSHDDETGNPNSPSARRMQADVQRNINQNRRIVNGIESGRLDNRELSRLNQGQARNDSMQARAGRDGYVGRYEQGRIQHWENRSSRNIYNQRHDGNDRRYGHNGWGNGQHNGWGNGQHNGWRNGQHNGWNNNHNGWNGRHGDSTAGSTAGSTTGSTSGHSWTGRRATTGSTAGTTTGSTSGQNGWTGRRSTGSTAGSTGTSTTASTASTGRQYGTRGSYSGTRIAAGGTGSRQR